MNRNRRITRVPIKKRNKYESKQKTQVSRTYTDIYCSASVGNKNMFFLLLIGTDTAIMTRFFDRQI